MPFSLQQSDCIGSAQHNGNGSSEMLSPSQANHKTRTRDAAAAMISRPLAASSCVEARRSWLQRDAALAQERAEAAEEQLLEREDFDGPGHVVWIPPRSRVGHQPSSAGHGDRMYPANVTVLASSDCSGSGSIFDNNSSLSFSTLNGSVSQSGNSLKVAAKANATPPQTANANSSGHKLWDDAEPDPAVDQDDVGQENPAGYIGTCSSEEEALGAPPSAGSMGHARGDCRPCSFATSKNGCRFGVECEFCHYAHLRSPKLSKKRRAHYEKFIHEKKEQLRNDPDAVKEIETSLPSAVHARPHLKASCLQRLESYADTIREQQDHPGVRRRHVVAL